LKQRSKLRFKFDDFPDFKDATAAVERYVFVRGLRSLSLPAEADGSLAASLLAHNAVAVFNLM
jgi:hypothetical protein